MRISWLSNAPWAKTGYGVQCGLFASRLIAAGHEIAVTAYYGLEGTVLRWNNIIVYPRAYDGYGNDVMAANAAHFKADILLTNMDTWVLDPNRMIHNVKWVPWLPIDHEPAPEMVVNKIRLAFSRIVYTKFAEQQLHNANLDCYYVPMGVDTKMFKPCDRAEARKELGIQDDKFIVGIVAMNKGQPSRKAFEPQLRAFSAFHKRHKDTALYLHSQAGTEMGGVDLRKLIKVLGIADCTQFCDPHSLILGFPDTYMVNAYNAMDVLMLCSMGEGFGIPVLEAQACGTPVIVGDWTSLSELCFSGWKIPKKNADAWWTPQEAYQYMPRVGPMAEMLERAYAHAREPEYEQRAREGALPYDADTITEKYWLPVLADIQRKIDAVNVKFV